MTEVHDLLYDWAYRHCPALLDDEALFEALCMFIVQVIDLSILAARRQVYRELRQENPN